MDEDRTGPDPSSEHRWWRETPGGELLWWDGERWRSWDDGFEAARIDDDAGWGAGAPSA
jgi:hypothetical protein